MKPFFAAALATFAFSTPLVAEAQMTPTQTISGTRLDLQATGQTRAVPDIATISTGVMTQAPDAATAMRDNSAQMARIMAALKRAGIADKDIQTQSVSLSPQYRYTNNETPVITGYQATNTLSVRFRDISKSGTVLDVLVKEGANQISGPTLSIEKPEAAQDAARLSAVKILQARAAFYAKSLGLSVKRIVTMSETTEFSSPIPVMARSEMAMDASAKTSIAPGEQSVNVMVSAVFELQ